MTKVYARNTEVQAISNDIADKFIEANHRHGNEKYAGNRKNIGLTLNGALLAVVSFSNPRTKAKQNQYQQELVRMTFKKGVRVIGGASKLIKYYIDTYKPRNFFTYQTTTGENTAVYEKSGMILISQEKHGDKVYEYENPEYVHYVYKIESTNDDDYRYYIGRHSLYTRKGITEEDLLLDGYFGSGGIRFQNWKTSVRSKGFQFLKTILSTQSTFKDNLKAEKQIIGNLYKTDDNCLNNQPGGMGQTGIIGKEITIKTCPTHGDVKHTGDSCITCTNNKTVVLKECLIHGESVHQGYTCTRCVFESKITMKQCPIHGFTKHQGDKCCTCIVHDSNTQKWCDDCDKETYWHGDTCMACTNVKMHQIKTCDIHGETKHRGNTCMKCVSAKKPKKPKQEKITEYKNCEVCGKANARHVNNQCMPCKEQKLYKNLECSTHGLTKHRGKTCCKCRAERIKHKR